MCHLILLLPVLALPILWFLPLHYAISIYATIALISGVLYWLIVKAMRQPLTTGVDGLIGMEAEVLSQLAPGHSAQYLVRAGGETWTACSNNGVLEPGGTVIIRGLRGISLIVESKRPPLGCAGAAAHPTGEKVSERHCH